MVNLACCLLKMVGCSRNFSIGRQYRFIKKNSCKKKISIFNSILICSLLLVTLPGCSGTGEPNSPEKKIRACIAASELDYIYDVLEDYPPLESCFTGTGLEIAEFEKRLFGDFLGNDSTADVLVALLDLFPSLIDTGTATSAQTFSKEVQEEMESKGPIPDLMAAVGALTNNIVSVEKEKIAPFYDYLEKLDESENNAPSEFETVEYIIDILLRVIDYFTTLGDDDINLFMNLTITDLNGCKDTEDGKLDFLDFEELIEKFTTNAPVGLSKILQGAKAVFYDEELKNSLSDVFYAFGEFLGDDQTYSILKSLIENLYVHYNVTTLGGLIEAIWDEGPLIGPEVKKMDTDGYGKDGKSGIALRELLMDVDVLNVLLQTIYEFDKMGYSLNQLDETLIKMVHTDNLGFDLKGEGEFGGGNFYEPNAMFSFKNFSNLKGLIGFVTRWSTPLTLTANTMYEEEGALETKENIRKLIPEADEIPMSSIIWSEIYERNSDKEMGCGKPVAEKKGYGTMINGVYVAPLCPAVLTGASMCLYNFGDGIMNGPYDNIYDNQKWITSERTFYLIIDLVQFIPKIPVLKDVVMPFFKAMGIKTLPVTAFKGNGMTSLIYLEVKSIIDNLPEAMSLAMLKNGIPDWLAPFIVDQLKKYMILGYPVEGTDRLYLFPQDVRDSWTIGITLSYWDSEAFHPDRISDMGNPGNYTWNYDVRSYSYEKNRDTANGSLPLIGALAVANYNVYNEVVGGLPLTLESVPARQDAARKAFHGIIYPFDYAANILAAVYERASEAPIYDVPDSEIMPFLEYLEPLIGMESKGVIDSVTKVITLLGKPELRKARKNILEGLAEVVKTIDEGSEATYTAAYECLEAGEKAKYDSRRWVTFKQSLAAGDNLFSRESSYQIVDGLIGLLDHLTSVDISDENWALATEGIIDAVGKSVKQRVLTRSAIHLTTTLDAIDAKHIWADTLRVAEEALVPGGMMNYVLTGIERDTRYTWAEICIDSNEFLHSDLMASYDEGTFWKDIYYLLSFLAEALQ